MAIKIKAKETKMNVGEAKGKYRFVLQAETYNTLSSEKVLKAASKNSGLSKGVLQSAWNAIGEVVSDWATEGHSVEVPGLGHMRFGIRATSVEKVSDVKSSLITARRVIFVPSVDIKQELANTSVEITCYDKDGKLIKTVTSTDKDDIEEDNDESDGSSGSGSENVDSGAGSSGTEDMG